LQASPSLHIASSAWKTHSRESSRQVSVVQSMASVQGAAPAVHTPSMHSSAPLQKHESLHSLVDAQG